MVKEPAGRTQPRMKAASPAEQTRNALVRAALKLFGQQGFDGTSTRKVAAEAKANIGSIAYHFGGKEGLRLAAADFIVETIQAVATQAMGAAGAFPEKGLTAEAAEAQLFAALDRMLAFIIAQPEAGEIVQFILRELSHPTAALDRVYDGVFEPTHKQLCRVWEQATGEPAESDGTKLIVFTLIGQVVYFRIGREAVMRRMGWTRIGDAEAQKVLAVTNGNLSAILAARKGKS